MEYFLVHGYTWVPPHWWAPVFLALAIVLLGIAWKIDPKTAPCRRFAYFCLASGFYFSIASRAMMLTDNGHSFDIDPAKMTALCFFAISLVLFIIAVRRKEKSVPVRIGRLQVLKGDVQ